MLYHFSKTTKANKKVFIDYKRKMQNNKKKLLMPFLGNGCFMYVHVEVTIVKE